jgi:hypothetical protein
MHTAFTQHNIHTQFFVQHNVIKAVLAYCIALMVEHHQKNEISGNAAREDARATSELLRRLKISYLSDDYDDGNDTPEEADRKDLIRRCKTRRLIERRKQDSEADDSFTAPTDPLPLNRRLSNRHDFLTVQIFLMDLEDMVVRTN